MLNESKSNFWFLSHHHSNFYLLLMHKHCDLDFGYNFLWWNENRNTVLDTFRGGSQTTLTRFWLFFWPPTPLRWHFLPYKRWQKVKIFDYLPTSFCQRSLWTPPCFNYQNKVCCYRLNSTLVVAYIIHQNICSRYCLFFCT